MPIYKYVKMPNGKIKKLSKGDSNKGGRVLYWKIHKVPTHHKTYLSALRQLRAVKASQNRRKKKI